MNKFCLYNNFMSILYPIWKDLEFKLEHIEKNLHLAK